MTTFSSAETKNRQQQQKITVIAMMMMMLLSVFVDGGSHGVTIVARHVH